MDSCTVIKSGVKVIATAGTRVQLVTTQPTPCAKVFITAGANNQGIIAVGDNSVVANPSSPVGMFLQPSETMPVEINDLSKVWLDATASGDLVTFSYIF